MKGENKELEDYMKCLEKSLDTSSFKQKPLSEVKNKYRKLKTFLSRAQTALRVKESGTGVTHKVSCLPNSSNSTSQCTEGEDR